MREEEKKHLVCESESRENRVNKWCWCKGAISANGPMEKNKIVKFEVQKSFYEQYFEEEEKEKEEKSILCEAKIEKNIIFHSRWVQVYIKYWNAVSIELQSALIQLCGCPYSEHFCWAVSVVIWCNFLCLLRRVALFFFHQLHGFLHISHQWKKNTHSNLTLCFVAMCLNR